MTTDATSRKAIPLLLVMLAAFIAMPAMAADAPVTIKLWDHHIHDKKFRKDIFVEFNKANPDIKVEYTSQIGSTYQTILDAAFRSGTPPDIFTPAGISISMAIEKGWIIPLDEIAPSKAALQSWMAQFPAEQQPFLEEANMFGGKVYSWPTNASGGRMMLFWNPLLFRHAGLKGSGGASLVPETWDDMRSFARKITELGQGKIYSIVHGIKSGAWGQDITFGSIATAAGWPFWGNLGFDFRTGKYDFHSQSLRGAIQLWIDMKKDGSVFPGEFSMDDEQAKMTFATNKAALQFGGSWNIGGHFSYNPDSDFDLVLPPIPDTGRKGYYGNPLAVGASAGGYLVSSATKNPKAVWEVIKFKSSLEYQEGWVQGGYGASYLPEANKVISSYMPGVYPTTNDVHNNVYQGFAGWDTFKDLDKRLDAALDEGIAKAQAAGVKVTRSDFAFPDWDPDKDYVQKKK